MNRYILSDVLGALRRCAFFSFVTAPSLFMFVLLTGLSFSHSLAGQYVDAARQLVANAPADKVWDKTCVPAAPFTDEKKGGPVALSEYVEPTCTPRLRDAGDWQKDVDAKFRRLYCLVAVLGLFVWLAAEGFPGLSFEWLKRRKQS